MNGKLIEQWEIDYIRDNYLTKSDKEIASHLKRSYLTVGVVRRKIRCLVGLTKRKFTKEEEDFIKSNFNSMSNSELAKELDRKPKNISNFINRKQLNRNRKRRLRITEMVNKMRELIAYCETSQSRYRIDVAKEQLRRLSGL